jgi:hypothetical protein
MPVQAQRGGKTIALPHFAKQLTAVPILTLVLDQAQGHTPATPSL